MLSPDCQTYLREVWGYERVEDIDPLTAECIRENAADSIRDGLGWAHDEEIVKALDALSPESAR